MKIETKQNDRQHWIACYQAACPAVAMLEFRVPSVCLCRPVGNGTYTAIAKSIFTEHLTRPQMEAVSLAGWVGARMQEGFLDDETIHPMDLLCMFTRPAPAVCYLFGWAWLAKASHRRIDRALQFTYETLLSNWDVVGKTAKILKRKQFHFLDCIPGGKC